MPLIKYRRKCLLCLELAISILFHFQTGYYCFLEEKCSFFYKNLLKGKFQSPIHPSSLSREFDINKLDWSTIYSCKISSLADKKISYRNMMIFYDKKSKHLYLNYYYVCICAIMCNCSYQYTCYLPVLARDRANVKWEYSANKSLKKLFLLILDPPRGRFGQKAY